MILVTGGAGFIGSVLVKELNTRGHNNIVVVDKIKDLDKRHNLKGLQFTQYLLVDEFFSNKVDESFKDFTYIFHIGACSSTTETDMNFLMENNVNCSKKLFRLASKYNIPFIYASSAATYGDGRLGYSDNHSEIPNLQPLNCYGVSKQMFDEWVLKEVEVPGSWFGLKFFNVFGPNEYHKDDMRSLVHKGFEQLKDVGKIKLFKSHKKNYKDGEQKRDFIYVLDVVHAMIELMNIRDDKLNGIYNLGTGKARTFLDLARAIFHSLNLSEKIEFFDMPENIRNQYQYFTQAEMAKFRKVLPGFTFMELEDAVEHYVKNYLVRKNPYF